MNEERRIKPESPALEDRLRILKETMPECFTEGRLDPDKLRELVGEQNLEEGAERYGLFWPGKREARARAFKPSKMALHRAPKEGVNEKTTKNLIIEGENLEVLRLLSKAYRGRVKMIYIDPPYNTGNDFVYDDKFAESPLEYEKRSGLRAEDGTALQTNRKSSGRYHSNWLSMMYPRLALARELLSDDGIIFISISSIELSNLRNILDEVFGEENFRGIISRATGTPTGQGTESLTNELDYILAYSKCDIFAFGGLAMTEENEKIYDQNDSGGRYLTRPLRKTGGEDRREDRPNMYYSLTSPEGTKVFPIGPSGYQSRWRCSKDTYEQYDNEGRIEWKKSTSKDETHEWKPYLKFYLEGRTRQPSSLWNDIDGNKKASNETGQLIGDSVFDFPKPVELIKKAITIGSSRNAIILDFFAGSGTTAQSVIEINEDDGGNRQFILVQMPETTPDGSEARKAGYETVAEITKERVRRVIKKINDEKGKLSDRDRGFRVYKLSKTGFKDWRDFAGSSLDEYEKQLSLHLAETDDKAKEEDLVAEIMLREGFPLDSTIDRLEEGALVVTRVGSSASSHRLFICLDTGFSRSLTVRTFEKLGIATEDVFICLDEALTDEAKLRIRELCRLATI